MTKEEIVDGNRLIAEFMDGKIKYYTSDKNETDKELVWGTERKIFECSNAWWRVSFTPKNSFSWHFPDDLKYHSSYDWLIPVVEKINTFNLTVTISANFCKIEPWEDSIPSENLEFIDKFTNKFKDYIFIATYYRSDLEDGAKNLQEAVYKAVIQFIRWYNKATTKK